MTESPMQRVRLVVLVCLGATVVGCAKAPTMPPAAAKSSHDGHGHGDDHDHGDHDHPTTLAAGIAALAQAATAVKEHLAADASDEADDAVHGLGHLLEDLPGLVRKEKLPAEAEAAATAAIDELFECFDKLDTALHAEPGKGDSPKEVHASIAERIEKAIGSIRAAARTPGGDDDEAAAIIRSARETKED